MIKAGTVLCHKCASQFEDAHYHCNKGKVHHVLLCHQNNQYFLKPVSSSTKEEPAVKYTLNPSSQTLLSNRERDRLLVDIKSMETDQNRQSHVHIEEGAEFWRCCPHCFEKEQNAGASSQPKQDSQESKTLITQKKDSVVQNGFGTLGYYPTYVIAVIGSRRKGKSCWLQALTVDNNIAPFINKRWPYPYTLQASFSESNKTPGRGTDVDTPGASALLSIRKKGESVPFANVLLLDFAGELFAGRNADQLNTPKYTALFSGTESIVDAFVLFDAFDDGLHEDENQETNTAKLIQIFNTANANHYFDNKPVAFVKAKMDALWNEQSKGLNKNSPDITEHTFPKHVTDMENRDDVSSFKRERMLQRFLMQKSMIRKTYTVADELFNTNPKACGFLLQSGTPIATDDSNTMPGYQALEHSESINLYDPLLWILNQLDIFPLNPAHNSSVSNKEDS